MKLKKNIITRDKCEFCNSKELDLIGKVKFMYTNSNVVICNNCKNVFKDYYPNEDEVISFYQNCPHDPKRLYKNKNKKQFKFLKKHVKLSNVGSVLEVGSGPIGIFSKLPKSINKYSLEVDKTVAKELNKNGIKTYSSMKEIDQKFDLIILSHIVEHVIDEIESYIRSLVELLNEDGVIFIEVPSSEFELMIHKNKLINHYFTPSHKRSSSKLAYEKLFDRLNYRTYYVETLSNLINRLEYFFRFKYCSIIGPFCENKNARSYLLKKYLLFTFYLLSSALLSLIIKKFFITKPSLDILIFKSQKNKLIT